MAAENNICFYNSTVAQYLMQAYVAYKWHADNGHTLTLKDVNGLTEGNVDTYLGTLSADTYDKAYFFTATGGATGSVTTANKYTLREKMKVASRGTDGATIENITTHTTTQVGDSGEAWSTNEHAGLYVYLNGGTGANQIAAILSNNTTILTLGETLTTDPDTTTDIAIVTGLEYYHAGASTATAGADMEIGYEYFYSRSIPYVFHVMSDKYATSSGTSSAVGATSLTVGSPTWTIDAMIGKWVQIYSATTNGYQYGYISDNSTTVLTITGWVNSNGKSTTPTGTPTFKIVDTLGEVFADEYLKLYITTYLWNLSNSSVLSEWKRIVDMNDGDSGAPAGRALSQDQDHIFGAMIPEGKVMFDYAYRRS